MKLQLSAIENLSPRYFVLLILAAWIGALFLFGLVRLDTLNLDEGAARALLVNWSVSDQIVNPVFILGAPDFRALIYAPLGIYWSGNILAAKIFSMLIGFFAVVVMFRYIRQSDGSEAALIASALVLISPLLLNQIDSMGAAPLMLLAVGLAVWLDELYRNSAKSFGAWYFLQLLWIAIVVTLHPIGFAYPIALALWWKINPPAEKRGRHMFIGIFVATLVAAAIKGGWSDIEFFSNPIKSFALALAGGVVFSVEDINWISASIGAIAVIVVFIVDFRLIRSSFFGYLFALIFLIGLPLADVTWAAVVLTLVLFRLIPILLRFNQARNRQSFFGQRGIVTIVSFAMALFFMFQAKAHALAISYEILSPIDEVIQTVSNIAKDETKPVRIASQWPGRTMIAVRRDVLPLPPAYEKPDDLVENALKNLTHIVFNPYDAKNAALVKNLSMLPEETETYALMKGGAILEVKNHQVQLHVRPGARKQPVATPNEESSQAPIVVQEKKD